MMVVVVVVVVVVVMMMMMMMMSVEQLLNENWHGKPKYLDKTCLSATLSTTNPT
jgi:hypothetical protein